MDKLIVTSIFPKLTIVILGGFNFLIDFVALFLFVFIV